MGTPMPLRCIPVHGGPDIYLDVSSLTSNQRSDLQDEMKRRNFYVQYLFLEDPMTILIEAEIRQRLAAEQEKA